MSCATRSRHERKARPRLRARSAARAHEASMVIAAWPGSSSLVDARTLAAACLMKRRRRWLASTSRCTASGSQPSSTPARSARFDCGVLAARQDCSAPADRFRKIEELRRMPVRIDVLLAAPRAACGTARSRPCRCTRRAPAVALRPRPSMRSRSEAAAVHRLGPVDAASPARSMNVGSRSSSDTGAATRRAANWPGACTISGTRTDHSKKHCLYHMPRSPSISPWSAVKTTIVSSRRPHASQRWSSRPTLSST